MLKMLKTHAPNETQSQLCIPTASFLGTNQENIKHPGFPDPLKLQTIDMHKTAGESQL